LFFDSKVDQESNIIDTQFGNGSGVFKNGNL